MKKEGLSFKKYLVILLIILSVILSGLIYFINLLPIDYYIIFIIILVIVLLIISLLLLSKNKVKSLFGGFFSLIMVVAMILGINYSLNTMNFFKQFGFNEYKSEHYNIMVLKENNYSSIKELNNKLIGYLDNKKHVSLDKVISKLNKSIKFESKIYSNVGDLLSGLEKGEVDAIIIEDAQLEILKEENIEFYERLKKLDSVLVEVKNKKNSDEVDVTKEAFNVYISGINTYGSINKVSRSDVNMIMSVNPKTKEILLTNIPRDYYVKLHTFGEYDKLTHAGIYGVDESISTLEDLFDININYYIKVNFTSLVDIVNALGGIEVNSKYSFVSIDGYSFSKGLNTLDGNKALSFARERKSFKEGDRVRGENQQLVLTAIIDKVMSPRIITNYVDLLNALNDKFITNISDKDITKLIKMQLDDNAKWSIKSISVNGTDSMNYVYSYKKNKLYVMIPDEDTVVNAKNSIKNIIK